MDGNLSIVSQHLILSTPFFIYDVDFEMPSHAISQMIWCHEYCSSYWISRKKTKTIAQFTDRTIHSQSDGQGIFGTCSHLSALHSLLHFCIIYFNFFCLLGRQMFNTVLGRVTTHFCHVPTHLKIPIISLSNGLCKKSFIYVMCTYNWHILMVKWVDIINSINPN